MRKSKSQKDLKYICQLIYNIYHISTIYINECGNIIHEYSFDNAFNPMYNSKKHLMNKLLQTQNNDITPLHRITDFTENFLSISIYHNNTFKGLVIMGPSITTPIKHETIEALIKDNMIPHDKQKSFTDYMLSLPVLNSMETIYASMQLYYMIYKIPIDESEIIKQNKRFVRSNINIEDPKYAISKSRESITLHHDELYERALLESIEKGDVYETIKRYRLQPTKGKIGTLSKKSYIRHKKNLGIVTIALATRASIKGGLFYEVAYTLSDLSIQKLEELNDLTAIDTFVKNALSDFAVRVQREKNQNYSKPVMLCLDYIFRNLYEPLNVDNLAKQLKLTSNYLSRLFKSEVGITLKKYIQKAKIDEAKSLLTYSDYSLLKISTLLNFHDQSYFTKIFKKYVGMTPGQYKNDKN